jgi:hypothetical protein
METNPMDIAKELIAKGTKNLALGMTFGAYHLYVIQQDYDKQHKIQELEYKQQKEELQKIIEANKRRGLLGYIWG